MRYLKSILLAFFISGILLAVVGFFLNSGFQVEKSITIHANTGKVSHYIFNLNNWPSWEVQSLSGGKIEITRSEEPKELFFTVKSEKNFLCHGSLSLEPQSKYTKVTWKMSGEVGNNLPQRYFILFINKLLGPDMETGLNTLKKICERD